MNDVAYICDRKACEPCDNPDCVYTTDINHAANFEEVDIIGVWREKEINKLTASEYQVEAMRTASGMSNDLYPMVVNGVMGLAGEAGECVDLMKKHLFQGHMLDKHHLAMELGDVAWYIAVTAQAIGYDLETVLRMNIEKLRRRYPDGFDSNKSVNREEDDI